MNALVGSHTMPDEVLVLPVIAVATVVGALAILAASSRGARSTGPLSPWRHLLATLSGFSLGGLGLAGMGLFVFVTFRGGWSAAVGWSFGCVTGAVVAYQAARAVGARMIWRRCRTCGVRFRSPSGLDCCADCDARRDEREVARAIETFRERFRGLP